jgi:hypothetical protein
MKFGIFFVTETPDLRGHAQVVDPAPFPAQILEAAAAPVSI